MILGLSVGYLPLVIVACGDDATQATQDSSDSADASGTSEVSDTDEDTAAGDTGSVETDTTAADDSAIEPDSSDTAEPGDTTRLDSVDDDTTASDTTPRVDTTPATVEPTAPAVGAILITELLIDPAATSDLSGEWVELHNRTDVPLTLVGCVLETANTTSEALDTGTATDFVILPGAYVVVAATQDEAVNGGIAVQATWGTLQLANAAGRVALICGEATISEVSWDRETWIVPPGASTQRDSETFDDPDAAADPARWCASGSAQSSQVGADNGTPGAENAPCPPRDLDVDFCEMTQPVDDAMVEGRPLVAAANLFDTGFTDASDGVDQIYFGVAEAGWGPRGSNPDALWTWTSATGAADWRDPSQMGLDRYDADLGVLPVGVWDVALRFSFDRGATWTTCDTTGDDGIYRLGDAARIDVVDSPCEPNPCTVQPEAACDDDVRVEFAAVGTCEVDGVTPICTYAETLSDCVAFGGRCDAGACLDVAATPNPGEVIFTEIMKNPAAKIDNNAEWLELRSLSPMVRSLSGCVLTNGFTQTHVISTGSTPGTPPLLIQPGEFLLLGRSIDRNINGDAPVAYAYGSGLLLSNTFGTIDLSCGGTLIDRVAFDNPSFPSDNGRSMQLGPRHSDGTDNDDGNHWCPSQTRWSDTSNFADYGSPGGDNAICPEAAAFCRLEAPADYVLLDNVPFEVSAVLSEPGLTDLSDATDVDARILVEGGYGPVGSTPNELAWTWFSAAADGGWQDVSMSGVDRYVATGQTPQTVASFAVAARVSIDGGLSYLPCDLDTGADGEDGSNNGYQSDNAGTLAVTVAGPCNPNPCTLGLVASECDGDERKRFTDVGVCVVDDMDNASCSYPPEVTDCAALGGRCEVDGTGMGAACVDVAGPPDPGDVVITEIMSQPTQVGEFVGEWVELSAVDSGRY
ncbi:MAG: hypothetical protein ACI9MR_003244, partial [Myxococcota bacterium]